MTKDMLPRLIFTFNYSRDIESVTPLWTRMPVGRLVGRSVGCLYLLPVSEWSIKIRKGGSSIKNQLCNLICVSKISTDLEARRGKPLIDERPLELGKEWVIEMRCIENCQTLS